MFEGVHGLRTVHLPVVLIAIVLSVAGAAADAAAPAIWILGNRCVEPLSPEVRACRLVNPVALGPGPNRREVTLSFDTPTGDLPAVIDLAGRYDQTEIWAGKVVGDKFSDVTLAVHPDFTLGLVTSARYGLHRVRSIAPRLVAVETLDAEAVADRAGGETIYDCGAPKKGHYVHCRSERLTVDVLVLYTEEAWKVAGGKKQLEGWIRLAEQRTNQSFANSLIGHSIRVRYIEATTYKETGGNGAQIEQLALGLGTGTGALHSVQALRNKWGADTVMLVNATDQPGLGCPLPKSSVRKTRSVDSAVTVVPVQRLTSADTFTHELGHNLGAGHTDPRGTFGRPSGPYCGKVTDQCLPWVSLMERESCKADAPLLYWSNLGPSDCDVPNHMGADDGDNASTIKRTFCTVSSYREPVP